MSEKDEGETSRNESDVWEIYQERQQVFAAVFHNLRRSGWRVDTSDILDIIHEFVVFRLPRALASYQPELGELDAWLFVVFLRNAKKHLTLEQRGQQRFELLKDVERSAGEISGEPVSSSEQKLGDLRRPNHAIRALDPEDREILRTWLDKGGSILQLAESAGCTRHTARKRLLEAVSRLAGSFPEGLDTFGPTWLVLREIYTRKVPAETVRCRFGLTPQQLRNLISEVHVQLLHSLNQKE